MPSTNTLQRTVNYAQQCIRNAPLTGVGGFANEPAFSIGDWVRQFILGAPFAWRWNRNQHTFSTVAGVQDYNLTNYLLFSQDFSQTSWVGNSTVSDPVVTTTTVPAPDGSQATSLITFPACSPTEISQITQTVDTSVNPSVQVSGTSYTFSIWLMTNSTPPTNFSIAIALLNPYVPETGLVCNVTGAWTRFSTTVTIPTGVLPQENIFVQLTTSDAPGFSVYAWGAQLEPNGIVNPYLPTTSSISSLFSNLGYIEKSSISDGTTQKELQLDLNLGQDIQQNRPISISPLIDSEGAVTMRLLGVPDKVYTVNVNYQKAAPSFQNLSDTWSPIPDYYYYLIVSGFLAKVYEYNNDERFAGAMQMFVKQVVAASAGMADTQKNIFLDEIISTQRQQQSELGNAQAGRTGRGLFG